MPPTTNSWNNEIDAAKSAITLNSGTNTVSVSSDAAATTVNIATGAAAKVVTLGSTNGASSLALKYGTADFSLASATGNVMVAQDTGEITEPLQPAFGAILSAADLNVTGDGTAYYLGSGNVLTEFYDQNSDFNAATGIFTAPVTGVYSFKCIFQMLQTAGTSWYVIINTTPQSYICYQLSTNIAISNIITINAGVDAHLTAGDTAKFGIAFVGGAKTTDSDGAACYCFGYLVC